MLKVLLLRKKSSEKKAALEELRKTAAGFATREAELAKDIEAASTEEEKKAVEDAVGAFEGDKAENTAQQSKLEGEIASIEDEIKQIEDSAPPATPAAGQAGAAGERKETMTMEIRTGYRKMTMEQRSAFVQREPVKAFLGEVRSLMQKRAVTNTDITIPNEVMPLLTDTIERYSKMMKHVRVKPVQGTSRVRVLGVVPEAVWTEQGGKVNELALGFSGTDLDGYKVAGFFAIPEWVLEDNDVSLLDIILDTLGQAIGLAVDKAVLYGTGAKMPLGIVTRLAQTADPGDGAAHADAVPWKDLHASNVISISAANSTGVKLFQSLLTASGAAKANYSDGAKFWAMNDTTLNALKAEALTINATGAIVSGMDNTMPIIGGTIETLSFLPDNVIIGGYGQLYLLAERGGAKIATSEHVRFLEDEMAAKGTARYDGQPTIPAGFVAIGIKAATVAADAVTFAADAANAAPPAGN